MIIVDLIILAVLLIYIGLGYKRGLTGCLLKIISFVLAIVIACILFKPVANIIINNTQIDDDLEKSIKNIIVKPEDGNETKEEIENNTETINDNTTMPTVVEKYINETMENTSDDIREKVADATARKVAITIINAGTWIILFIIAKILLVVLKIISNWITKLPIIKQFDKLGGIIYGLAEALIIIYFVMAIISFISPMIPDSTIILSIKKSFLGSFMYNSNLLLKIIF